MASRYKGQPASKLLLAGSAIGEKKNFVGKDPTVHLPQQFTGVLGPGVAGNEDLFRLRQPKIESGSEGWYCLRVRLEASGERGERLLRFVAPPCPCGELREAQEVHGGWGIRRCRA